MYSAGFSLSAAAFGHCNAADTKHKRPLLAASAFQRKRQFMALTASVQFRLSDVLNIYYGYDCGLEDSCCYCCCWCEAYIAVVLSCQFMLFLTIGVPGLVSSEDVSIGLLCVRDQ